LSEILNLAWLEVIIDLAKLLYESLGRKAGISAMPLADLLSSCASVSGGVGAGQRESLHGNFALSAQALSV
jgi:hypothetical protein